MQIDEETGETVAVEVHRCPDLDLHGFPGHVLYHYAGTHLRCICRAYEVLDDGDLHGPVGHAGLLPALSLGLGGRHFGARLTGRMEVLWRDGLCGRHGRSH